MCRNLANLAVFVKGDRPIGIALVSQYGRVAEADSDSVWLSLCHGRVALVKISGCHWSYSTSVPSILQLAGWQDGPDNVRVAWVPRAQEAPEPTSTNPGNPLSSWPSPTHPLQPSPKTAKNLAVLAPLREVPPPSPKITQKPTPQVIPAPPPDSQEKPLSFPSTTPSRTTPTPAPLPHSPRSQPPSLARSPPRSSPPRSQHLTTPSPHDPPSQVRRLPPPASLPVRALVGWAPPASFAWRVRPPREPPR